MPKNLYIGAISTVLPRECGIATFNDDFLESIGGDSRIFKTGSYSIIRNPLNYQATTSPVEMEIEQNNPDSWKEALEDIIKKTKERKKQGIETGFFIEHEYGIFKENVRNEAATKLLRGFFNNDIPNITIAHTILKEPKKNQERIMRNIIKYTNQIICLTPSAVDILREIYDAPREKLIHIPHGIPKLNIPEKRDELKKNFGLEGKTVISTLGFISNRKGIEYPIEAFSTLKKEGEKDLVYIVAGTTHPEAKRLQKEKFGDEEHYRNFLINSAEKLGLNPIQFDNDNIFENLHNTKDNTVIFLNKFLESYEFLKIMKMSDLGIVPNLSPQQISSGQIAYWVGMGRQYIATASPYAKDMENEGVGFLVDFKDSNVIYKSLKFFLKHSDKERKTLELAPICKGATMYWEDVGKNYINVMERIIQYKNE